MKLSVYNLHSLLRTPMFCCGQADVTAYIFVFLHWPYFTDNDCLVLIWLQCLQSCPEGKYGANCSFNCTCMNGATCDPVNGTCSCTQGWKGRNCSTRACPDGLFGQSCLSVCQCIVDNTDMWVLEYSSLILHVHLKPQWVMQYIGLVTFRVASNTVLLHFI
jgi:hypothetical protein